MQMIVSTENRRSFDFAYWQSNLFFEKISDNNLWGDYFFELYILI